MKEKKITAYKGFDKNLCCRGFQYEIGKEYEQEGEIKCCENGFHACTNPFDVLDYYSSISNNRNRYCEVEQSGIIKKDKNDSKSASSKIKIKKEIGLIGIFEVGVKWIKENIDPKSIIKGIKERKKDLPENPNLILSNRHRSLISSQSNYVKIGSEGEYSKISTSGYATKIGTIGYFTKIGSSGKHTKIGSSGNYSRIGTSGNYTCINLSGFYTRIGTSGDFTTIGSSGDSSKISSSGNHTKIGSVGKCIRIGSSGDCTLIGASGSFAQIGASGNGTIIDTNGNYARISLSGNNAKINSNGALAKISSSGDYINIDSTGKYSVICCAGQNSMAKAKIGSWITLSEWKYSKEEGCNIPVCVKTEYVDGEHIKADTWYKLIDGEFKEQ